MIWNVSNAPAGFWPEMRLRLRVAGQVLRGRYVEQRQFDFTDSVREAAYHIGYLHGVEAERGRIISHVIRQMPGGNP